MLDAHRWRCECRLFPRFPRSFRAEIVKRDLWTHKKRKKNRENMKKNTCIDFSSEDETYRSSRQLKKKEHAQKNGLCVCVCARRLGKNFGISCCSPFRSRSGSSCMFVAIFLSVRGLVLRIKINEFWWNVVEAVLKFSFIEFVKVNKIPLNSIWFFSN